MAVFILDASVCLAWCFEDETTDEIRRLFERLSTGDSAAVPAHWPIEVSNGLLLAHRRKRISPNTHSQYWNQFFGLPIIVNGPLEMSDVDRVMAISEKHGLTTYDGAYVDLALRRGAGLASLDSSMIRAAKAEGISLLLREK
jgi:predicted nucleic acid-binding protein